MENLTALDWGQTVQKLQDIIRNPQSNVEASILLLAAFSIVVVLVLLTIGMFFFGGDDDEDEWDDEDEATAGLAASGAAAEVDTEAESQHAEEQVPKRPLAIRIGIIIAWSMLVLALVWVLAGVTTAQDSVCLSCHGDNPHTEAKNDPHQSVRCIACHEPTGAVGSLTTAVPPRVVHFAAQVLPESAYGSYGQTVSSGRCQACHGAAIRETLTVEERGIRVSHKEPLDAGAECLDCHALADGAVSNRTVGMAPCLRCHDGTTATVECEACHTRPMGTAAEPGQSAGKQSLDRIGQPDCGTCHDQTTCDACHGTRMPHSEAFMAWGHAREGVEDIWDNGGQGCAKCHNATKRPCTGCHTSSFPQHGVSDSWRTTHGAGGPNNNACICHARMAYVQGRNFCGLCHEVVSENGVWRMVQ